MSLTTRVLVGLIAGLGVGALISALDVAALDTTVSWISVLGLVWVNALRMTIVPLVMAGLIVGAASARDARSLGRLGGRALVIFLVLLTAAATFTVFVGPALMGLLPIDPTAAAALRANTAQAMAAAGVQPAATGFPDFRQWFVDLVPSNPVRAAADGGMLAIIVFSLAIGIAITRIGAEERATLIGFFRGLFDSMLVLIRWVLELAPIGVFALALPLASTLGLAAAGAVVYYVIIVVGLSCLFIALLYPIASIVGRVSIAQFARGVAPAQAVAISARSSLASLPAMIQGGEKQLGFPVEIRNFFLPLSASTFRIGGAIGIITGVLFVARLYGVDLAPVQLATVALTTVLITFSIPGVPAGSILIMAPVLISVGLPAEGIGILLGVDTIPDMFRTTTNVTGTMTAATILADRERRAEPSSAAEPDAMPQPTPIETPMVSVEDPTTS
ncbi:MAG: dicarboxylate/amino acid:cation symporter [Longimicrobiales bacterium]